jgi:flagellar motor switch protein FliN/FliY
MNEGEGLMSTQPVAPDAGLEMVMDIEVPITIRFGTRQMVLDEILKLDQGAIVELDRMADEPVELLVSGRVLAKGEVVVVEGNYAVRITEILSPAERIRSLSN